MKTIECKAESNGENIYFCPELIVCNSIINKH